MAGKEYREVRKRLGNEPADSSPYVGYARALLGELKADMAFNGLMQGIRRRRFADGTTVEAISIFGQDEIRIQPPRQVSGQRKVIREKTIVNPRWVFCANVETNDAYLNWFQGNDAYVVDLHTGAEPRFLASTDTDAGFDYTDPNGSQLVSSYWNSFDWGERNLAVAFAAYNVYYFARIDPITGKVTKSRSIGDKGWATTLLRGLAAYDGVTYATLWMNNTFNIVIDTEIIDVGSSVEYASSLHVSNDGKFLIIASTHDDVAPPYTIDVYNIETRSFVGSYERDERYGGFDIIGYAWCHITNSLYMAHTRDSTNALGSVTRLDLTEGGGLSVAWESDIPAGRVYSLCADDSFVYVSAKIGFTSDPGFVQVVSADDGALGAKYIDPESVGQNWPLALTSTDDGNAFMIGSPYMDDADFRLEYMGPNAEFKRIYKATLIPNEYGAGHPYENDTERVE